MRAELGERFPGLVESESWASVDESLQLLGNKPKFEQMFAREGLEPTLRAMIEAAARLDGLEEIDGKQESADKRARRADRDGGQPSTKQSKPSGPASGGSSDRSKFDAILRKSRGGKVTW